MLSEEASRNIKSVRHIFSHHFLNQIRQSLRSNKSYYNLLFWFQPCNLSPGASQIFGELDRSKFPDLIYPLTQFYDKVGQGNCLIILREAYLLKLWRRSQRVQVEYMQPHKLESMSHKSLLQ
jgi:hypothetical protein